jgi:predicted component of viral defense system (DUF524 family)
MTRPEMYAKILKDNPGKIFSGIELANIFIEEYPKIVIKKMENFTTPTVPEVRAQLSREIASISCESNKLIQSQDFRIKKNRDSLMYDRRINDRRK